MAIDLGTKNLTTRVVETETHRIAQAGTEGWPRFESIKMSAHEGDSIAGHKFHENKMAHWEEGSKAIRDYNKKMPSANIGDLANYFRHAAHIMQKGTALMAFHLANRVCGLKRSTYIKEQRAWVFLKTRAFAWTARSAP